jgi:hypothetical protein
MMKMFTLLMMDMGLERNMTVAQIVIRIVELSLKNAFDCGGAMVLPIL